MTRGPIPRFDLYEELEVSRLASAEVIEAAYRTLVKRHHPDVSDESSIDADRIKRLNVAHGWLTSPAKRRRYDEATDQLAAETPAAAPGSNRRQKVADPTGPTPMQEPVPMGFGPYSNEVRQFLADLRPINLARAESIRAGKAAAPSTAYAEARGAALDASRRGRHEQWLLARDAATVIAKGKLGDWAHAAEVAAILADIAGAFVVRDRIPPSDFELLLSPWTFRAQAEVAPARVGGAGAAVVGFALGSAVGTTREAVSGPRRPVSIGVAAAAFVAVLGVAIVLGSVPKPEAAVAAATDAPASRPSGLVAVASPLGGPFDGPSPDAPGGASASPGTIPNPTDALASPALATAVPPPDPTPRVTARRTSSPTSTPVSTTAPSPVPTTNPTASATPGPTPSPPVICTVVSLIDLNTSNAQPEWNAAGFTGTVLFSPAIPPQYKIGWQSLAVGTDVPCTSDITVQQMAP